VDAAYARVVQTPVVSRELLNRSVLVRALASAHVAGPFSTLGEKPVPTTGFSPAVDDCRIWRAKLTSPSSPRACPARELGCQMFGQHPLVNDRFGHFSAISASIPDAKAVSLTSTADVQTHSLRGPGCLQTFTTSMGRSTSPRCRVSRGPASCPARSSSNPAAPRYRRSARSATAAFRPAMGLRSMFKLEGTVLCRYSTVVIPFLISSKSGCGISNRPKRNM